MHNTTRTRRPAWVTVQRKPLALAEAKALYRLDGGKLRTPEDVVALLRPRVEREEVEVFYLLALNAQSELIDLQEISRGTVNSTLVHPPEVFRYAIHCLASGIIVAHNHPSGDPTPSPEDRAITRQLEAAGRLLDVRLCDHVVIGATSFVSFATAGLM